MAERVLSNVAGGIIARLGSLAFKEIGLIWGVKDEFRKLKETVAGFQAVLLDAEQKQANNETKLWLESVENAVYEADDVLDEFNTEAQRRQIVPENTKLGNEQHYLHCSHHSLAFSSLGGMVDVKVSFTAVQREELERQWTLPLFHHNRFYQFPRTH